MLTEDEKIYLNQCTLVEILEVSVDFVTDSQDGLTREGQLLANEAQAGNIYCFDNLVRKPWSLSYLDEECSDSAIIKSMKSISSQYGYEAFECFIKDGFVWLSVLLTAEHFSQHCGPFFPSYMKMVSDLTFTPSSFSLSFPCRKVE